MPDAVAGRLVVEIEASAAGFARDLRRKVDEAAAGVAAKVGLELDTEGFRERLKTAVETAAAGVVARVRLDIDRQHLQASLVGAVDDATSRTQATVNTKIDRDRIVNELRQVLAEASANPASTLRIPTDIDQGRLIASVRQRLTDAEQDITRSGGFNIPFKLPGRGALIAGLLTLVQPVVGALGQWVAGATMMVGAMAPAVNTLGAIPGLISGVAAAFIGAKIVFSGFGTAIKAVTQQQQALANGTKLTKAQQQQMATALKGVSKSARESITAVVGMQGAWKKVKLDAQERFFSQISKQIAPLGKALLPLFGKQINGVADALGKAAKGGAKWMQTPMFKKDFATIASTNTKFVGSMTRAFGSLGRATEDWLVAAAPFTDRMGKAMERGAQWVQTQVAAGRESGKLNRALNDGAGVADQLGRSLKYAAGGLYGFFKAGRGSGQNLLNGLESTLFRFDHWAKSKIGSNKIAEFFKQAEPGFHQFNMLIGDIVRGLGRMASDGSLATFIQQIRSDLVPGIGALLRGLGGLGGGVIQLLGNLAQILGRLAEGAKALAPIVGVFSGIASGLAMLLKSVPGLSSGLGSLLVALLALSAAKKVRDFFVGPTTQIGRFRQAMTAAGTAARESARQQGLAAREATGAVLRAEQQQMAAGRARVRASAATRDALAAHQRATRAQLAATGASERSGLRTAAIAARQRATMASDYARALRQESTQAQATATASTNAARITQATYDRSVRGLTGVTQATTRWGTAMQAISTRFPGLASGITSMQTAFRGAQGDTSTFATRLSGIGRAAGVGLMGSMRSLVGFLGGPWGVALIAAGVALNFLAKRQQKAAEAAQEHTTMVTNLQQALIASKGLIDGNVRAQALADLQNKKIGSGTENLVTVMKKAGISANTLVDAYTGQSGTLGELETRLRKVAEAHREMTSDPLTGATQYTGRLDPLGQQALAAADALGGMKNNLVQGMAAYKDYADVVSGSSSVSLSTYDKLRSAAEGMALANGDAETRVSALRRALDLLGGGTADYESANATLQQTIQGINDGMADQRKNADALGTTLIDKTTGGFNQSTKAGLQLYSQFTQLATEGGALAQIAFDNAKQHGSLADAVKAAEKAMKPSYDTAKKLGKEYNLTGAEVQGLSAKYGLLPSEVVTLLKTEVPDETTFNLLMVKTALDAFPDQRTVTVQVESLTDTAKHKLDVLGIAYKYIPATKSFEITVKDKDARARLTGFLEAQSQIQNKAITLGVKDKTGRAQLEAFQKKVLGSKGKAVTMSALTKGAEKTLTALGFKVTHMKDGRVKVNLPTGNVKNAASIIQGYIDGINDKNVTLTVTRVNRIKTYSEAIYLSKQQSNNQADGGIMRFFANGGIGRAVKAFADGTEKHIAQIAPAGSWRVWAEPETGGEAYLPLAPSKRGRSKEILDQVAEMFGGQVVYNAAGSITASDLYRAGRASSNSTRPAAAPGQMALVGGDLILQRPQQESTQDSLAAAMFELRRIRLGGGGNA